MIYTRVSISKGKCAMVSVEAYAAWRGISEQRVRELLRAGELSGRRVGKSQWEVDDVAFAARPRSSRPMSPRMAWALIRMMSGEPLGNVAPSERSRLRSKLLKLQSSQDPAALLSAWLKSRGERKAFSIAPQDLDDLEADDRVMRSGISDPRSGISSGDKAELWVRNGERLNSVIKDYLMIPDPKGQVILHSGGNHPDPVAPIGLVLADLADWNGPRENGKVAELLAASL